MLDKFTEEYCLDAYKRSLNFTSNDGSVGFSYESYYKDDVLEYYVDGERVSEEDYEKKLQATKDSGMKYIEYFTSTLSIKGYKPKHLNLNSKNKSTMKEISPLIDYSELFVNLPEESKKKYQEIAHQQERLDNLKKELLKDLVDVAQKRVTDYETKSTLGTHAEGNEGEVTPCPVINLAPSIQFKEDGIHYYDSTRIMKIHKEMLQELVEEICKDDQTTQ